jgi:SAM-dependent methyltransferase
MIDPKLQEIIDSWTLPHGSDLQSRLEDMIQPALFAGHFGRSFTRYVCRGLQYHLGGARDTEELASLAEISADDRVMDVGCFLGGPALALAEKYGCKVTGIDLSEATVAAASRMAEVAGLDSHADFRVGNAENLPFAESSFTVVWSQGLAEHSEAWVLEFHRVLCPGGRLAFTFQTSSEGSDDSDRFSRHDLAYAVAVVARVGYDILHTDDISLRDVEIGWNALDRSLTDREEEFSAILGADWVRQAHQEFAECAEEMRSGRCGNGRIVAVKKG